MRGKVGAVAVVGGGIAGMQAALDLAECGMKVYLLDSKPGIGGVMSMLDKTFPTNDCAMCTMAPRLVAIGRHKDIDVITYSDIEGIEGKTGALKLKVRKRARYVKEDKCTGCGECVEKCPIERLSEYNLGLDKRKAIYRMYPQIVPNVFTIEKLGQSPCRFTCPAGQKAHGYIAMIRERRYDDAYKVILRDNPFPSVCGRVCNHKCEDECTRGEVDEPVSIMALKRFVADWAYENRIKIEKELPPLNGKKVAIVGGGPAGLTAAKDLREKGYRVTIFESLPFLGGMMRVGIPAFRLPKDRLEWDIHNLLTDGIEVKTNHRVESINELLEDGFDAVFIATGTHVGKKLRIPGADLPEVLVNIEFLKGVNLGKEVKLGERVLVIGGGNVAMDTARTALRLGPKKVSISCLESRDKMPADEWEIEDAEEEGIEIFPSRTFLEILSKDGHVAGVKCSNVKFYGFFEDGRPNIEVIPGSEHVIEADTVIFAIGQGADIPFKNEMELTSRGFIKTDQKTLATSKPGVFAGGDVVTGTQFIVDAIGAGHRAAKSIDCYLRGEEFKEEELNKVELSEEEIKERIESPESRHPIPKLPVHERKGFEEVNFAYAEDVALKEAERCLRCAICSECLMCVDVCELDAIDHSMKEEFFDIDVGAVILSPGYEIFEAGLSGEYGYGRYPNVITSLEFERILSASGPFAGKVLRPYDQAVPKKIAFVQCVGSRDTERPWCSSVCCMYATKEAIIAKEHNPDLKCKIFYRDLRAFGKGYEAYYERAKEEGIEYIRGTPSTVKQEPRTKNLKIQYRVNGEIKEEDFDLVVLCVGISPRNLKPIAEKLNLKLNEFGFIETDQFFKTNLDGVFATGVSTGPKDIPESVMEASAAASGCLALLHDVKGTLITKKEYPPERDITGEEPRVGVFVCHCGTNIAGVVNVPEVIEYVKTLPNVVYAENNLYTCSADTCERIKEIINEHKLNRVVVASCTPRTHEPLFMEVLKEAGLNPYLFEMANIRDQCSWVHAHEPERATKKAKDLIRMTVAKVKLNEPLYPKYLKVNKRALVIGGGIAGMTAALEIARQGYEVHLVEKEGELGGLARRIKYTLEGDIQALLKKTKKEVKENKKIKVHLNSEVSEIEGSVGNFRTTIKTKGKQKTIEHGVVILATGAKEHVPQEYLYGKNGNVLTQLELEEKLANGGLAAKNFVMIQCVGSREAPREYCSRVCCSEAIKNGLKIKELDPEAEVYVLHRDVRTYGFYEKFYREAREKGIKFIRYDGGKPEVTMENGGLMVSVHDMLLDTKVDLRPDVLVLSSAIEANELNKDLSQKLKVPLTQDGFFLEAHMKLRPIDFATEGMFVCGTAHGPKTTYETIAQAMAAATRASTILSKDELEIDPRISEVIDENCDGCAYCIEPCPFDAVTLIEYMREGAVKKTVEVDISKCQGCGTCVATCPKKGIEVKNFRMEQLAAMIEAALVRE